MSMKSLNTLMAMTLMMGVNSLFAGTSSRSNGRRLVITENTKPHVIVDWFLDLTAEEQKKIIDSTWERKERENASDFLTRRNILRSVKHFIDKNPEHKLLKYKSLS